MKILKLILCQTQRSITIERSLSSASSHAEVLHNRKLIIDKIDNDGKNKLKSTSVLIVGFNGLGYASGQYLASAGIGKLGLIINDNIVGNKRDTDSNGKTKSAIESLKVINSNVEYEPIMNYFDHTNAVDVIKKYDIIIDAADNVIARYLLSDACVVNKKSLISASTKKFDAQLTVYNYDSSTPCYRCLFPTPPQPVIVNNYGILNVIPGIIGSMQALEAIKIAIGIRPSYAGQMLLFDSFQGTFTTAEMKGKKSNCISCGIKPKIGPELMDYEKYCREQSTNPDQYKVLESHERVSWKEYKQILDLNEPHLLIDVRPKLQSDIIILPNAKSIPLEELKKGKGLIELQNMIKKEMEMHKSAKVFMMCRKGIASQTAVKFVKEHIKDDKIQFKDIKGGIDDWTKDIDPNFPVLLN